ncbi:hypothetical protein X975_16884, partial [Stegodyphus mimosarum]
MSRWNSAAVWLFMTLTACFAADEDPCDLKAIQTCLATMTNLTHLAEGYFLHPISKSELKENCEANKEAITCAENLISQCVSIGQQRLFDNVISGKIKLVEELCTEDSRLNTGFFNNIDCWEKIRNDTLFCNEKFEEAQRVLQDQSDLRLKTFHSCCSFDWHRQCKMKAAQAKCNCEAAELVDYASTLLGDHTLRKLCESSYSSCYGVLYGVEVEDLDERYGSYRHYTSKSNILDSPVSLLLSIISVVYFCI